LFWVTRIGASLICGVMRKPNRPWPPELETLDQLVGGDMALSVIRQVFPTDDGFVQGIFGLLQQGDVVLVAHGAVVPEWQVRVLFREKQVLGELERYALRLTKAGASKVG
jgi:hypothetical protein